MLAIGVPTYNEKGNIAALIKKIDAAADFLGLDIIIVNADSASTDETVNIFLNTETNSQKISLINNETGKGRNVRSIIQYIVANGIEGCVLIDGDVTSFDSNWLKKQAELLSRGFDYVIPTYARNFQEGNTTNHFVYPLLGMRFNGVAPRQPISGDFGISLKFAQHMDELYWHSFALGYGVDIFMTLHAMCNHFKITEISLGRKIHSPSFDKMVPMFQEVASSYYETSRELALSAKGGVQLNVQEAPRLIQIGQLNSAAISERKIEALSIYHANDSILHDKRMSIDTEVTKELWAEVLLRHEMHIYDVAPGKLAASILPWYLMRVVNYLENCKSSGEAILEINNQYSIIVQQWTHEANPHSARPNYR